MNDNIPVAGESVCSLKSFFQKNELVRGEFSAGERRVAFVSRISCPLLIFRRPNPTTWGGTCLNRGDRAVRQLDRYRDDGN